MSARRLFGNGREEGIGRCAEGEILDLDLRQAVRLRRAVEKAHAQVPRFRLGQQMRVRAAVAVRHASHRAPARAVVGEVDVVAGCVQVRQPAQYESAELARLLEIHRDRLLPTGCGIAAPSRVRRPVEGVRGCARGERGRRVQQRCRGRGRFCRQFPQCELLEADRSLPPTLTAGDDQLDRRAAPEIAVCRGAPGEFEVPLLEAHALPFAREREVGAVHPPHVFSACVDELELERVGRRVAAQAEGELVVPRVVERQLPPRDRVAGHRAEIEVETQRIARAAWNCAQARLDAVRCRGLPRRDVAEVIQQPHRSSVGGGPGPRYRQREGEPEREAA